MGSHYRSFDVLVGRRLWSLSIFTLTDSSLVRHFLLFLFIIIIFFSLSAKTCLNMTTVFSSSLITLCRNNGQWPPLSSLPDGWACSVECRPCCRCHNHWVSRTSGVQWLSAVCCGPTGAACARQEDKPNPYHPPEIHRCVLRSFYFWLSWLMKIFTNCALRNTGSILWTHREQSIISERRLKTGINITYKSTCLHISSLMEFPTSIFHFI